MTRARRKYSAEFKRDAVQLAMQPGQLASEVAAGLGINRSLLCRWQAEMKAAGGAAFPGGGRPKAGEEEVLRLRKELARTQQERDILKKAVVFFASEHS